MHYSSPPNEWRPPKFPILTALSPPHFIHSDWLTQIMLTSDWEREGGELIKLWWMSSLKTFHFGLWVTVIYILWEIHTRTMCWSCEVLTAKTYLSVSPSLLCLHCSKDQHSCVVVTSVLSWVVTLVMVTTSWQYSVYHNNRADSTVCIIITEPGKQELIWGENVKISPTTQPLFTPLWSQYLIS